MNKPIAIALVMMLILLAWASWMFRYMPLHPTTHGYIALDRWTGRVLHISREWVPTQVDELSK